MGRQNVSCPLQKLHPLIKKVGSDVVGLAVGTGEFVYETGAGLVTLGTETNSRSNCQSSCGCKCIRFAWHRLSI